jgi:hypothetical protein
MDWTTILVAILALCGTAIGSVAGVKQANKVVDLRINNLEKKMDKHNCLIERMTVAERDINIICHRIDELEDVLPRVAKGAK